MALIRKRQMIDTIIIDDEPYCCEMLSLLLQKHCPEVNVIGTCLTGMQAIDEIQKKKPQLVFLDIEMPDMNGFDVLQKLPEINFQIIFATSYDQYAIKAIKFSALDYLLKPIDEEELQVAVKRTIQNLLPSVPRQLEILLQKIRPSLVNSKIALPTAEGLQMIPLDTIISCSSDSNYSIFSLKGKQKIVVSRTLKEIEELLDEYSFIRVHHSYLVNLDEVKKYIRGEGGYLLMSDGSSIDVSRSKKEFLLKKLLYPR
jgi:two-component system LytT family response regulator